MLGVAVGTMALIIVLSVFNGLEDLLRSLYNTFDPELKIEASKGKTFELSPETMEQLRSLEGVSLVTEVAEDYVYVKHKNAEMAIILKGVGDNFKKQSRLDDAVVEGEFKLKEGDVNYAVIGKGVQYGLSIASNSLEPLVLHYVKDVRSGIVDPSRAINRKLVLASGFFALEKQLDESYVIVSLETAVDLFNYGNKRTSLEIQTSPGSDIDDVQSRVKQLLGPGFKVLNSDEQHATLLRTVRIEKLFVYIIFSFILAVASFNIFFSLTMLAIDKKKDISILYSVGATDKLIRKIFLTEGAIISITGASVGLLLGWLISWSQERFGLISMGMQTSILDYYPIKIEAMDFLYTGLSIMLITILASFRPAKIATRYNNMQGLA